MHVKRIGTFAAGLLLLLTLLPVRADSPVIGTPAATLRIAAAANLQKVLTEALIPAFEKKSGVTVIPTFGSTKLLAAQLEQGAPDDVFIAADTATVEKLVASNLLIARTVQVYAIGHLVVWSRKDVPNHPSRLQELAAPAYAKIAIANPALAPYGLAAQQAFEKSGLTAQIAPKLVQAENIGQCLQYAQSGNADVALTALALVIEDKNDPYFIVPDDLHAPIAQSLGLSKSAQNTTLGLKFIAFLTGKDAARTWKRYGYSLPKK